MHLRNLSAAQKTEYATAECRLELEAPRAAHRKQAVCKRSNGAQKGNFRSTVLEFKIRLATPSQCAAPI